MEKKITVLFLLCFFSLKSQINIKGKIVDGNTKEYLSFTEIKIEKNNDNFLADIDGEFTYQSENEFEITFDFFGYKTKKVSIVSNYTDLIVEMERDENIKISYNQRDSEVYKIIQKVIDNKNINNPYSYNSFEYNSYNKVVIDREKSKEAGIVDFLDIESIKRDTTMSSSEKVKILENSVHILVAESFSKRRYLNSESEEALLANRLSGIRNSKLPIAGREFQSFSFYEDVIDIMSQYYVSPLSNYGMKRYNFKLVKIINDTLYQILFKPSSKNIDGIEGTFFINKNKYALYALDIKSREEVPLIRIKQKYTLVNDKWFPKELYYKYTQRFTPLISLAELPITENEKEIKYKSYFQYFKERFRGIYEIHTLEGRNYISNININIDIEDNLGWEEILVKKVEDKDDDYWIKNRVKPLNLIEKNTYTWLDSQDEEDIRKKIKLNRSLLDKYIDNTSSYLELDIDRLLNFNIYEGIRTDLALRTTEKLSNKFSFGFYVGYGLSDKGVKFGGDFNLNILRQERLSLSFDYKNDIFQAGSYGKKYGLITSIFGYKYDKAEIFKAQVSSRIFKYLKVEADLSTMNIKPQYDILETNLPQYKITSLGVNFRFAFREKFFSIDDIFMSVEANYPIFNFSYKRGINNFLYGQYDYNKIEFNINQELHSYFGLTNYFIEGGYVDRVIPYGQMFTADGINDDLSEFRNSVYVKRKFQTMYFYEFLSDRYINIFTSHIFKNAIYLFRILEQDIIMDIILDNNISYGYLKNKEQFLIKGISFKTKEKIYSETGVTFNFRFIGFGVFYRYGSYSLSKASDNIFLKLGLFLNVEGDRILRARGKKMSIISYFLYN